MRNPESFPANFESAAKVSPERLPFDRFVEHAAFEVIAALPFVESSERALPREDSAGADGFVKVRGLDTPLAIDVTVTGSKKEVNEKLGRVGQRYGAKLERPDAKIAEEAASPIKMTAIFFEKKDFADLYEQYRRAPETSWKEYFSPDVQRTIFREFLGSVRRFLDVVAAGASADRQFHALVKNWNEMLKS